MTDEIFMRQALQEAKIAFSQGEVPVGAVLVFNNKVIATGYNQVEFLHDASAHAEMICLRKAAILIKNWRLLNMTLYTTLEPCAMCLGAIHSFRVERLVWGAKDLRQGACGSWIDLSAAKHPIHRIEITSGVLEEESAQLMKDFFVKRRMETNV